MARDDFTQRTKETLAKRVGCRCSNPECRALTTGPHSDGAKAVCLGVAAHITAASPGGPRYNESLSTEQRKSADNGIWLCQMCGKLVDDDVPVFSVDILHDWKNQSEDLTAGELNTSSLTIPILNAHLKCFEAWRDAGGQPDFIDPIAEARKGHAIFAGVLALKSASTTDALLTDFTFEFRRRVGESTVLPNGGTTEATLSAGQWCDIVLELDMAPDREGELDGCTAIWISAFSADSADRVEWHLGVQPDLAQLEPAHTM
jgi:hypothetical protein